MSPLVNIAIPAVLLFLCCTVLAVSAQENRDEIKVLPGFAMNPEQKMYSGYIQVDPIHNRQLFYWFVESSSSTRGTDPLVLWTNGGPGCSSVSGGLFSEFGPFFPKSDGSLGLTPNPWTWTSGANVIFIEQPAGVGFSFSDDTADYTTGDKQSADDIYMFLQSFLQKYPQFLTRDFYLTGESYGGHYVPKFAQKIIEMNRRVRDNTTANAHINLKGFAIGNAWTVAEIENTGAVDFWYQRTMIDATIRDGIFKTCNMSDVGPLVAKTFQSVEADWEIHFQGVPMGSKKAVRPLGFTPLYDELLSQKHQFQAKVHAGLDCDAWQAKAFDKIGGIDIYDIYADVCVAGMDKTAPEAWAGVLDDPTSNSNTGCATNYDPCRDDKTTKYINDIAVKHAIHANVSVTWTGCSSVVNYSRFDLLTSMLPVYAELLNDISQPLRVLIYSGDVDAIVPTVGTREWVLRLGLKETAEIRPWLLNKQVGGWVTEYEKDLTFATVRNAGHLVPGLQGSRALYLFQQFISGKPL